MKRQGNVFFDKNKHALRRHLREVTEKETEKFLKAAQNFYDASSRTEDNCLALINDVIESINNVVSAGGWDDSLFLKTTIKPLHKLLNEAQTLRSELLREKGLEKFEEHKLLENDCKLYISLYQADGHDLGRWALQLASIDKYTMGRPIYKNEADVIRAIRRKLLQTSEAYAVIVVDKRKIISEAFGQEKTDRHGFQLLALEQGFVKPTDVIEFVHGGKRYHYCNMQLIVKG